MNHRWSILIFSIILAALVVFTAVRLSSKRKPHSVTLTWHASVSPQAVKVVGYNIYRRDEADAPGKDYSRIASRVPCCSYTDTFVKSGHTYDYAVSTVDSKKNESARSALTTARIP